MVEGLGFKLDGETVEGLWTSMTTTRFRISVACNCTPGSGNMTPPRLCWSSFMGCNGIRVHSEALQYTCAHSI